MLRRPLVAVPAVLALALLATAVLLPSARAEGRRADIGTYTKIGEVSLPAVGNAVLLAVNSIQIDRDVDVLSGDVVVSQGGSGPFLGEAALSLDRGVTTAAGYSLRADSIDLDQGVVVGGDAVYNQLSNDGTIQGSQTSPLDLPVFAALPPLEAPGSRPPTGHVTVPAGTTASLDEGSYGILTVGDGATLRLTGGKYTFDSISVGKAGALAFAAPAVVVVRGKVLAGSEVVVGPEPGSGAGASDVVFHVHGINGLDGLLASTPRTVVVGKGSSIAANLYAPFGTAVFDRGLELVGAVIARDILVARGDPNTVGEGSLALDSAFGNRAPTAFPQTVRTHGAAAVSITLSGFDPEGGDLAFSIVSPPAHGSVSPPVPIVPDPVIDPERPDPVQPPVTSATVTYTPATGDDLEDSFTFAVTDPAGASGSAVVTINPPGAEEPPPPPPETVVVPDTSDQVSKDTATTLSMAGKAPEGVSLTFAIVPGTGPAHGTLGPVVQGSETPQRTATVLYTPDPGFLGADAFDFEACGEIAFVTVCDTGTFSIQVVEPVVEPPVNAPDRSVTTPAETEVEISLSGAVLSPSLAPRRVLLRPRAAFIDGAEVAGNVADANGDGFGDNHNALPGSVPVFMSAGVDQAGGAGSNGTVRMHVEWDVSGFGGLAGQLESAEVILSTHRGTTDSLDTFFFWVAEDGDGLLTDSDFEATAEQVPGVVMPVPPGMAVGADGSFSFSVLGPLASALDSGFGVFSIQGRVDESLVGPARGLEVRTTAAGNLSSFLEPRLSLATPGVTPPLVFTIETLPAAGTLRDGLGTLITTVPYTLPDARVSYTPSTGFLGQTSFQYGVSNGVTVDFGLITVTVALAGCETNVSFCDDGR